MNISEIVALAGVVLSMGTNIGLYIHLSSVMNTRFDSAERKAGARHESIDRRLELNAGGPAPDGSPSHEDGALRHDHQRKTRRSSP